MSAASMSDRPARIACTKFCVHPERRTRRLLKVGGTKDPRLDDIVALSPDLVLMNDEENRREDYEALTERGVDCHSTMPRTIKETFDPLGTPLWPCNSDKP